MTENYNMSIEDVLEHQFERWELHREAVEQISHMREMGLDCEPFKEHLISVAADIGGCDRLDVILGWNTQVIQAMKAYERSERLRRSYTLQSQVDWRPLIREAESTFAKRMGTLIHRIQENIR